MDFNVKFTELNQSFNVKFTEIEGSFNAGFGEISIISDAPRYTGDYEVTPKVNGQTLETKGKLMNENVEINAIPYFNVSNASGGNTVYIGNEV